MQQIDYVVPMVFTDDPVWQAQCAEAMGRPVESLNESPRWRSWGTEELLVKAILKFMPWIRRIHILLSGESQVQPWMKDYEKVNVVFHKDFIPEEYRPCFVSRTVEMFLGSIPGLAAQFIYGNDDMYPLSPLEPTDFFRDGKPCQHLDEVHYEEEWYLKNIYKLSCFNELNMIASGFDRQFTNTYLVGGHSINPILRRTCKAVWQRHGEDIARNISPKRTEHSMNQYIYTFYQHLSGKYVDYTPTHKLVSVWDEMKGIRAALRDKSISVVCVNDDEVANTVWESYAAKVREELDMRINQE